MRTDRRIAVIGLGHVGLPVAVAFARNGHNVVAFDVDPRKIEEVRAGKDRTGEVDAHELAQGWLLFTTESPDVAGRDFFIITVPTPIDEARPPNMSAVLPPLKRSGVP
jgi:UDP-N-acetyl-D-glucosamine/UDP-N-acetyl-D-galactosamine dehydrogenase